MRWLQSFFAITGGMIGIAFFLGYLPMPLSLLLPVCFFGLFATAPASSPIRARR